MRPNGNRAPARWSALLPILAALSVFVYVGPIGAQSTLGAPTASVSSPTTNTLTVTWTAPSDNGGAAITAYDVQYIRTDDDETVPANWILKEDIWVTGGGTLTYTLTELEDGVGYDVQVRAENANGDIGPWSTTAAGTTTDHGGTTAAATDLSLGSSVAGHLTPATDEDVFEITLGTGGEVWIYTTGLLDTFGELLNSDGTVRESANHGTLVDAPRGFEFREELTAGTYYVRVSSYEDEAAGAYRIHAQTVTDPGSTIATAATVTLDSATPGRIGSASDADFFKLVLDATTDVWVMSWGNFGTDGELYDSSQNRLSTTSTSQFVDDSETLDNEDGFIFRRSLGAGTYYIKITGDRAIDTGPYTLNVRTAVEPGSTTATAAPLTFEVAETGRISSSSDQDYFSLTMAEDTYVYILAVSFGNALALTPVIQDSMGDALTMHVIPHSTWSGRGDSEISFSVWGLLEAGTYHIRVSGSTGAYLIDTLPSPYNEVLEECTAITTTQSDPLYGCQWHLKNTGQFGAGAGQDINVESVWAGGNKGEGINIALLEDSLQTDHEDLVDNVLTARNRDLIGQGNVYHPLEFHGTAIAGLIAARDNDIGVRGVAPRANIFIYDITRGTSTNSTRAIAGTYHAEDAPYTAISNNSWGPSSLGMPREVEPEWEEATRNGVTLGYGGKGILYVWSGGNGHLKGDNSNLAERTNYYTGTTVCAVGYDDLRAEYSEMGANLWLCAPAQSGRDDHPWITTTHIPDRYRTNFGSTSGAAAIVSGVAALVRAANTDLTWRDVKLILAASARKNDASNTGWTTGALEYTPPGETTTNRYNFNHEYGFGMVDAAAAVALADGWTSPPALRSIESKPGAFDPDLDLSIPDAPMSGTPTPVTSTRTLESHVGFIEYVEVEIEMRHFAFRDLLIELVSPSGTVSELSVPADRIENNHQYFNEPHRFGSARHLGENAAGTWTLRITDKDHGGRGGDLDWWRLRAYGHGYAPGRVDITSARAGAGLASLAWDAPADIGGSAITSYDLRYKKVQDSNWTTVPDVGALDDRTHTLTGLDGTLGGVNVGYALQIRAVNDAGGGRWSATSSVQPWRVAPDAPRSVSTAARNQALAVSWRTPNYWGAQPLVAYHIRYIEEDATDKSDSEWTTVSRAWQTGGGELRYVIRGLTNGTEYEVQVQAENIRTTGGWSSVASGTPQNINGPAEFPGTRTTRSVLENAAAGTDIGDPVAARDDEGDTLTYSLRRGTNILEINSATGQLQTKFAFDRELASRYFATVAVHDGKASDGTESTGIDDTIDVTIEIEDIDEPPLVTGSETRRVRENTTAVATYSASDPESATTTFTWSLAGADFDDFAISSGGVLTFDPAPNYEAPTDTGGDNTYNVTVQATDDSATDPGAMTGEFDVTVSVQPVDEPPGIRGDTSYTIAENSARRVGSYTATDPEGASTTWLSLTGTDALHFTLDEFGTLSFVETPDYDTATNGNHGPEYHVTLRASDGRTGTAGIGTLPVTITLTPVPEGPLIEGDSVIDVNEGHTGTLDRYRKRDPEDSATNWGAVGSTTALGGADADAFTFDQSTGRLMFTSPPDYEDGGGSYQVTLNANDGVLDGSLDITVNVTNLDERAAPPVQLGAQRGVINVALTATLTDPDNVVSATWQWQRSTSRTSGWADIANTDASSYTPTADDRNLYLRATVSYEDGHGPGKSADAVTERTTVNERLTNTAPVLPDSVDDIAIPENAAPGRSVGSPVQATDAEGDDPVYTLSGASQFVIGRTTGQIRVAAGAAFDYDQGQRSYTLTVTADDGFGGTDTVDVTINLTDVNEPPDATDDAPPRFDEDTAVTIDVLANDTDPENHDLTVTSVTRPSRGSATLNSDGTITYTPNADYHGSDTFTYRARDAGGLSSGVATVALTIDGVNDAPVFASATVGRRVSASADPGAEVGAPVTATDVDTDDTHTYSLSGPDAFSFDIGRDSGQITVAAGVTFDIATQDTYEVTVTATDSGTPPRSASVDVTITVTTGPVGPPILIGIGGGGGGGPSGPTPSEVDFEWTVEHDIDELDSGHDIPAGMWSDGATLWLLDNPDGTGDAVYAYSLESGERAEARDFELSETNRAPRGVWSDRTTIWVSDSGPDRLFAHDIATGERTPQRDIELDDRNADPRGIWSDGETMWVLDNRRNALFAYDLGSGELLGEYALADANDGPHGIWSDLTTIWVSNHDPKQLFAYRLPRVPEQPAAEAADPIPLERVPDEDFTEPGRVSNNSPRGIWSDGAVMYVADENDGKVYSYNMPDAIDARLRSLELEGVDLGEFSPARTEYEGVPGDGVTETTVASEAVQDGATVVIEPVDADDDARGHQVALAGVEEIVVTVTSADGSRERLYRVSLPAPSEDDFAWNGGRDIEQLDPENDRPTSLWSDGATLWVLESGEGSGGAVYAYDLETGERLEEHEFALDETNRAPRGVWSDRVTVWVSDSDQDRLFAYDLETGKRTPERDIELDDRNGNARGIWSDGEVVWVLDGRRDALFAYDLASGKLLGEYTLDEANDDPRGVWSDRVTVWVSNHDPKQLFAYRLPRVPEQSAAEAAEPTPLERVRDEEFTELSKANNNSPRGLWSDGDVMYVADEHDGRVYSYNMPDAIDARLRSLELEGVDIGEFSPARTEYEGVPGDGVTQTTVAAEAVQDGATVVIEPPDADEDARGHQVELDGVEEIVVAVTSADGSRERLYRVSLPAPSEDDFAWNGERDIEQLDPENDRPTGLWSDGATLWVIENGEGSGGAVYAYDLASGERAEEREFALDETNRAPRGVWSDRVTVWVSDSDQDRLFAYDLGTGERDEEREFALAARNGDARGIWSDGEAMWVLDADGVFVYDIEAGALLGEYTLDPTNTSPHGIWSDHTTIWVSNHDPKRLFAYRLPRVPEQPAAGAAEPTPLERVPGEDFTELSKANNNSPWGIWSDGDVMYVADENDGRVYSYNMPDAIDARLVALELSRVEFGAFSPLRYDYMSETIPDGNIATLTAIAARDGASVEIEPADHDGDPENGYQVRLLPGLEIAITVTSADGSRERVYRLLLGEEEATAAGACLRGAVATGFSLVFYGGGSIEELEACAESRHVATLYALEGGAWVPYIIGAPGFVNRAFVELFSGGVPPGAALVARSAGPPSEDPSPAPLAEASAECLRGEVARGFSIVVFRGGSVQELDGCARSTGVTTLYALDRGSWVPYIIGAPGFVNRSFVALYAGGLGPGTPLVAKSDGQPAAGHRPSSHLGSGLNPDPYRS